MCFVKNKFILFFFVSCLFSLDWVVSYKGVFYSESDFYSFFPKNEWNKLSYSQKNNALSNFIKRKACLYEAENLGLSFSVDLHKKIRNRFDRLLVNEYYMRSFLGGLIPKSAISFCNKNLKKDVFVNHILLPFSEKDSLEVFSKASLLKGQIINGASFDSLATLFSKDPSVSKNTGSIGWVSVGQTVPSFQNKIFSLCVGCVDLVQTSFGFHVVRVDSSRVSDYSFLDSAAYNDYVFRFASSYIDGDLSALAAEHDSLLLVNADFYLNNKAISSFINDKILNNDVFSLRSSSLFLDSLRAFDEPFVSFNSNVFSGVWLANLLDWGMYKSPFYDDVSFFSSEIKLIALRQIVKKLSIKKGLDFSPSFLKQYNSIKASLIEKNFLKHLKSSVPKPSEKDLSVFFKKNPELFVNPKTDEPYLLDQALGSVEAVFLKQKQDSVTASFLNSLTLDSVVKINKGFIYED